MLIKNGLVFTQKGRFERLSILAQGGRITGIVSDKESEGYEGEVTDAKGCYVLPGLTDIHLHGAAGHDFCEGTREAFETIAAFEFAHGVMGICPATMTIPEEKLGEVLKNAAAYREEQKGQNTGQQCEACFDSTGRERATFLGIHLEGPFINPHKKGAQRAEDIQKPSLRKLEDWQRMAGGLIRIVTLAPEIEGGIDFIREGRCRNPEIRFSVGHTECDYERSAEAFRAGADHVTHLFNAMPPFLHRAPGVIGAAFDRRDCFAELICDGIHVDPSAVRAAFGLFGDDRIILISDSMEAVGMPDGEYVLGGQEVLVREGRALLRDGTLAGSTFTLYDCLRTAVNIGIPLESAVKAATINPCRSVGLDGEYGSIEVGKKADFLLLDQQDLRIRKVIRG